MTIALVTIAKQCPESRSGIEAGIINGLGVGLLGSFKSGNPMGNPYGAGAGSAVSGAIFGAALSENQKPAQIQNSMAGAITGTLSGVATSTMASIFKNGINVSELPYQLSTLLLGTLDQQTDGQKTNYVYSFDCWKQVLHDTSDEPSNGRLIKDVAADHRIVKIELLIDEVDEKTGYPKFILQNIWDERFKIEYVILPTNNLITAHAIKL